MKRRLWWFVLAMAAVSAWAQPFPNKPIRIIVQFGPGTSTDLLAPLPDVQTVAEAGIAGYEAVNWYGVFLPGAAPKEIIARVSADVVRILKQPDVQSRFAGEGGDIVANSPDEFGAFIRREIPKWTKVVKDAGVRVD